MTSFGRRDMPRSQTIVRALRSAETEKGKRGGGGVTNISSVPSSVQL